MRYCIFILLSVLLMASCSKKTTPAKSDTPKSISTDSLRKSTSKADIPKVIIVNDSIAKKDVDGRLYFDRNGRRYWKNYRDGKYYLFNKKMYDDYDYKPRN